MAARWLSACLASMLPLVAADSQPLPASAVVDEAAPAARPDAEISTLSWMTGDWQTGSLTDGLTREHWEPMRGGTKLGLSQTVKGRVAGGFEFMRIVRHAEGLVFYGAPEGKPAVEFTQEMLVEQAESGRYAVAFVNRQHDFPKRISYRLAGEGGNMLVATISGADPRTDSMTWQYHRREAPR